MKKNYCISPWELVTLYLIINQQHSILQSVPYPISIHRITDNKVTFLSVVILRFLTINALHFSNHNINNIIDCIILNKKAILFISIMFLRPYLHYIYVILQIQQ